MAQTATNTNSTTNSTTPSVSFGAKTKIGKNLPGIVLVAIIAFIAHFLGKDFPLIGSTVIAILIGMLLRNYTSIPVAFEAGVQYSLKKLLKLAIIFLGTTLSFWQVLSIGGSSLLIIVTVVTLGILLTMLFSRWMGLQGKLPALIGVGTAICGATAIATVSPVMRSKDEETAFAVTTIFIFNVIAVIAYPILGSLFQMSNEVFGVWAGTAIHDTSSVVAAGIAYSDEAGGIATVVKLTRTLFIIPLVLIIAVYISAKNKQEAEASGEKPKISKIFPWFVLGFVGMALLNTFGVFTEQVVDGFTAMSKFLILMAMVAVGLGADFKKMKSIGFKPIYAGLVASILVAVISLGMIYMLGMGG